MSEIVRAIEKSPWEASYDGADDPLLQLAMCATEHARKKVPSSWLHAIKRRDWQGLARAFATVDARAKALVTTTQAVDIIRGGSKVNALPELVTAVVNHRIAFSHSIADVEKHLTKVIAPVAKRFNMPFYAFEESQVKLGERYVTVSVQGTALEPAPRSPTAGAVWDMFAGSARHSFKDIKHGDTPYIVSPGASTGNSDTKVYWNLSRNIFRFGGSLIEDYESNIHSKRLCLLIEGRELC
jgi:Gly-Xaa carboxypeptidase